MNTKSKLLAVLLCICLMSTTAYGLDVFSIKTSLSETESVQSCTIPVVNGEVLELSAEDLEKRLSVEPGTLTGITLTALPTISAGALFLDGVEAEVYDFFTREEIDRLCFVHNETAASASITFVPQGAEAVTTSLDISVLSQPNQPPSVEGASFDTMKNVNINGFISVVDPEEDSIRIQVVKKPTKGAVSFTGPTFVYEPYKDRTGSDSFSIYAVDSVGNYSAEVVIDINIEKASLGFTYTDMNSNPSLYAALKLHERGVMTGRQVGGDWFFYPGDQVNRGDYLIMVLAAAGYETSPTVNTGLPNDANIPLWLKPYVKKGIEEGIIGGNAAFNYWEIPMRAEAVLMADRAADITDVKEFALTMPDAATIPEWAQPSYRDLAAYKMLDLHDGYAHPERALDNSYAADLAWQLYKHKHR